ncbi:hypothetical protein CEXT_618251 [Caerostris extrusa]|uniref:Uncharacterized protein n=1 Tax=Caerostris extrusa TaxID=172846 RepID=A0AAV4MLH2_CAEEX|nr:hypothetical protein CEXT_618251 [Caerostris extrusa]
MKPTSDKVTTSFNVSAKLTLSNFQFTQSLSVEPQRNMIAKPFKTERSKLAKHFMESPVFPKDKCVNITSILKEHLHQKVKGEDKRKEGAVVCKHVKYE